MKQNRRPKQQPRLKRADTNGAVYHSMPDAVAAFLALGNSLTDRVHRLLQAAFQAGITAGRSLDADAVRAAEHALLIEALNTDTPATTTTGTPVTGAEKQ